MIPLPPSFPLFFFNDTATTEIYTLSLHDALPIFLTNREVSRRESRAPTRFGQRPNKRLKLPGGDRARGSGVLCAGAHELSFNETARGGRVARSLSAIR